MKPPPPPIPAGGIPAASGSRAARTGEMGEGSEALLPPGEGLGRGKQAVTNYGNINRYSPMEFENLRGKHFFGDVIDYLKAA